MVGIIGDLKLKSPHESYYWQLGNKNSQWVMREDDWKLYAKAKENVRPQGVEELSKDDKKFFLVNLKEDPGEKRNWAGEFPDRVKVLINLAKQNQADLENSKN